jgi:hypothetical protein
MPTPLGNLSKVIVELVFFDDEKALSIRLHQSQIMKSLHEESDLRRRRAYHVRQFFMGNLQLNPDAVRVLPCPVCGPTATTSGRAAARCPPSQDWR